MGARRLASSAVLDKATVVGIVSGIVLLAAEHDRGSVLRAGCILRQVRTWKLVPDEGLAMLVQVWRVWSMGEEGSTYK